MLERIRNKIVEFPRLIELRLKSYENNLSLLVEDEFDTVLCNITNVELLKDILYFFGPNQLSYDIQ
jgi:hypothetical protein